MLELLAGAGLLATGWVLGRINRRRPGTTSVKAICLCSHHIGEHQKMTGRCVATVDGPDVASRDKYHDVTSWVQIPCTCQHYAGPELISSFTMRAIAERPVTTEEP